MKCNRNRKADRNLRSTSRDKERLRIVEVNSANRTVVLIEAINESAHTVVPELDDATVQTRQDPWPLSVEAQSLHSVTLRLELGQHRDHSRKFNSNFRNQIELNRIPNGLI